MRVTYYGVGTLYNGLETTTADKSEALLGFKNFSRESMWDHDDEACLYAAEVDEEDMIEYGWEIPPLDRFTIIDSYKPENYAEWNQELEVYCTDASILPIDKPFQAIKCRLNSFWLSSLYYVKGFQNPKDAYKKFFYEIDGNLYDADNFVEF